MLHCCSFEREKPYHKKSKEDDSTAPNICPAAIILLPLNNKFKGRITLLYTHTETHTDNSLNTLTYPYDFWTSIMWRSISTEKEIKITQMDANTVVGM